MLNDLDISKVNHVYVKPGRTDLRRGIEGLCAIVREDLGLEPLDGSLFLFCGTKSDRIKGLLYERDGYLLLYKRTSDGKFHWPKNETEAISLTQESFNNFMKGFDIYPGIRPFQPTAY